MCTQEKKTRVIQQAVYHATSSIKTGIVTLQRTETVVVLPRLFKDKWNYAERYTSILQGTYCSQQFQTEYSHSMISPLEKKTKKEGKIEEKVEIE